MRIVPRPSAPTAAKTEKAADGSGTKAPAPAVDQFTPTEAGLEYLVGMAARLTKPDRQNQIGLLSDELGELKKERHLLAARVDTLQAAGPSPQLDQARAQLATLDAEIAAVTQQLAALTDPPKHFDLSAVLLRNKPIIG